MPCIPMPPIAMPGAAVKAARRAAGLTQFQLATRLGITQSSVADTEADRKPISLDRIMRYAAAIGCDPGNLDSRLRRPEK